MKLSILTALIVALTISLKAQTYGDLIVKGDDLYAAKNYKEAINYFSQAIKLDASLAKGFWFRADAYRALTNYDAAVNDYTAAIALEPKNAKFYKLRGDCNYN